MLTELLRVAAGLGALVTLWWAVDQLRAALRSRNWPSALATIVRSERVKKTGGEGATYWEPQIEYAFTVAGTDYRSTRIRFGVEYAATAREAERICRKYPTGCELPVRYNPRDPYEVALETGVQWGVVLPFIYALLLAFLAWGPR